jgi:mRNA interferase HigB
MLRDFYEQRGREDAKQPLLAWARIIEHADWSNPAQVKELFGSADFVGDRIIFNIGGNKYRLIVAAKFAYRIFYVRFVGTHEEYDSIEEVKEV